MSDEFPFLGTTQALNTSTLPLFKTYAWNFDNDDFIFDEYGNHILLEGNDALKVWILKALKTERFAHLAYSWKYGTNHKRFIGKVMGVGERKSELRREITEALMVNPYVKSINKVEFVEEKHNRKVLMNIELTTIYGKLSL